MISGTSSCKDREFEVGFGNSVLKHTCRLLRKIWWLSKLYSKPKGFQEGILNETVFRKTYLLISIPSGGGAGGGVGGCWGWVDDGLKG